MLTHSTDYSKAHTIVWAFSVRPQYQGPFEAAYGSTGDWAQLFARQVGYQYTRLYRNLSHSEDGLLHYLCEDVWDTRESCEAFFVKNSLAYQALDERCAAWTVSERRLV